MLRYIKPLDEPPGIRKISPGKNKDVFCNYETMVEQVKCVMDTMGLFHPDL